MAKIRITGMALVLVATAQQTELSLVLDDVPDPLPPKAELAESAQRLLTKRFQEMSEQERYDDELADSATTYHVSWLAPDLLTFTPLGEDDDRKMD